MCQKWGSEILLDYVQGRLSQALHAQVAEHAKACEACTHALEDLRVIESFSRAASVEPGAETDRNVLATVRQESERRQEARKAPKPGTRRIRLYRSKTGSSPTPMAWAAAAAVLFLAVVIYALTQGTTAHKETAGPLVKPPQESPAPAAPETARVPPAATGPQIPTPTPIPRPSPAPAPAPVPVPVPERRDPPPAQPEVVKKPEDRPSTTVAAPVEFGRIVQIVGKSEIAGKTLAREDRVHVGDVIACGTGSVLVETSERSLIALRGGAKMSPRLDGEHVALRLDGEGAFSVAHRPERRFVVETAHGTVAVKGTVFSVRAGSASTVTVVAKGKVEKASEAGTQLVPAGHRSSMSKSVLPSKPEAVNAAKLLSWAEEAGMTLPGPVWIAAAGPQAELQAPMTRGRTAGSLVGDSIFASIDSQKLPSWGGRFLAANRAEGGFATYTIEIPETGAWYLWGRFYHPGTGTTLWKNDVDPKENDPNSFYVSVDGGKELVFGNHKTDPETRTSWYRRWHWGGDGTVEVGRPVGLPLGTLAKGRHTIRVRNRDAVETSSLHLAPRLDTLCLTADRDYRPREEDFRR